MSATIPETMLLSDLLKATGYECTTNIRACCVTSGKLFCWKCETENDIFYTFSDCPIRNEKYIYGSTRKSDGTIGKNTFDDTWIIEPDKLTINLGDSVMVYVRAESNDIVIG